LASFSMERLIFGITHSNITRTMKTSPRLKTAFSKAVEILEKASPRDLVDAYRILVEHQAEIGYPVNYGLASRAYKKYLARKRRKVAAPAK